MAGKDCSCPTAQVRGVCRAYDFAPAYEYLIQILGRAQPGGAACTHQVQGALLGRVHQGHGEQVLWQSKVGVNHG